MHQAPSTEPQALPSTKHEEQSTTSDSEVLVRVEGVSKIFCRDLKKSLLYGLQDSARDLMSWGKRPEIRGRKSEIGSQRSDPSDSSLTSDLRSPTSESRALRAGEFLAVDNVSFELKRGECLGLIGRNGAGKTTLLKMLNGLIKPDSGRIEMRGRVGALIALGAGFNPILSGRENIYVNGSILGLTKAEIDAKMDDIIDFAEIGEFIDAPVQSYSSGMSVRLGFSIASSLSPDILILDEVLAVGDIGFVIKCLNRVRQLSRTSAVIFVSHTMQFVSSFCTRVIVMKSGTTILDAENPQDGINCYFGLVESLGSESGAGGAVIERFEIQTTQPSSSVDPVIHQGQDVCIEMAFRIDSSAKAFVRLFIDDESQTQIIGFPLIDDANKPCLFGPGTHQVSVPLGPLDLNSGRYSFMVGINDASSNVTLLRKAGITPFRMVADVTLWSKITRPSKPTILAS